MNSNLKIFGNLRPEIKRIFNTIKFITLKEKPLIAVWWLEAGKENWGDALNPVVIEKLSGKKRT